MHSNRNLDTQVATDFDKLCKVYPKVLLVGNYITFFSDIQVTSVLPEVMTSLILLWDINISSLNQELRPGKSTKAYAMIEVTLFFMNALMLNGAQARCVFVTKPLNIDWATFI